MSKPITVHIEDWSLTTDVGRLEARPSGRTLARQLWVTGLTAAVIVALIWWFGLPPGSKRVAAAERAVAEAQAGLDSAQKQLSRVRGSTSGPESVVTKNQERVVAQAQETLEQRRAALGQTQPTLGTTGNTLFWSALGLLALVGIGLPLTGLPERFMLEHDGHRGLRLRRRWGFGRSHAFHTDDFAVLDVSVRRLVRHNHDTRRTHEHGWVWTVVLATDPQRTDARDLHLACEWEKTRPTRPERLTTRVRLVVDFLQRVTNLSPQPPVVTDVSNVEAGLFGTRTKLRTRRAGPIDRSRYGRL